MRFPGAIQRGSFGRVEMIDPPFPAQVEVRKHHSAMEPAPFLASFPSSEVSLSPAQDCCERG